MQKKDLKPGTVYGYESSSRGPLRPVVFLTSELHGTQSRTADDGTRNLFLYKPRRASMDRYNGYLVLTVPAPTWERRNETKTPDEQVELLAPYVDRVPEIVESLPTLTRSNGEFRVGPDVIIMIVNSRDIQGPWEDVYAARRAADAKSAEFDARGVAWETQRNRRLERTVKALIAVMGEAPSLRTATYDRSEPHSGEDGRYRNQGSAMFTLEQMETLVAALAARPVAE